MNQKWKSYFNVHLIITTVDFGCEYGNTGKDEFDKD